MNARLMVQMVIPLIFLIIGVSSCVTSDNGSTPSTPATTTTLSPETSVSTPSFAEFPSIPTLIANIDHDVTLQGVLGVIMFDNPDGTIPPAQYILMDGKGHFINLDFSDQKMNIPLSKWVKVVGQVRADSKPSMVLVQVQQLQTIEPPR
jgi:hypothetical protein